MEIIGRFKFRGLIRLEASTGDPEIAGMTEQHGLALAPSAETPRHRLQRALNDVGLVGKEFARAEPRVLVRVEGFVGIDDPRAGALTRSGLDSVRVLGSYARI